ncbi:MAG: GNAT family N-acetyltransferase [Candidatus Eisenbacteria sp.]|nr:GNAT family N-acetyltransferase [Candidatus Eisenbacteria bacterium]
MFVRRSDPQKHEADRELPERNYIPSVVEIAADARHVLAPLFEQNRRDTVLIGSVLEGRCGASYADSDSSPSVARLDSGAFTMLGGNPDAAALLPLLRHAPVCYVTPENVEWRRALEHEFGDRISAIRFTEFLAGSLDESRLRELSRRPPEGFELRRVDKQLAERLPSDLDNDWFFESFESIEDFLDRGIGYCVVHGDRIASAATSVAMCGGAIDIEIETASDFRRRGLGTTVGARLVLHCVQSGIDPKWLAANPESEALALRLGYEKGTSYETFELEHCA